MGFLTPWFFAGLLGVGLPIWLHLLRKHKTTPLPFSSLMFFEQHTLEPNVGAAFFWLAGDALGWRPVTQVRSAFASLRA